MLDEHRFADAVKVAASRERAQEILREAQAEGRSVLPCGQGTRLQRNLPGVSPGRWLSVAGMQEVRWLDVADQTCCVEAGMAPAALQALLAPHGLQLDALAPHMESGTLGGLFLSRERSLLAATCGPLRDQVLGATWLLADGSILRSGARVVKSVAGYDVTRLLLGSRGRLAICLDLTLRLRPLSAPRRWFRLDAETWHRRATTHAEPQLMLPCTERGDSRLLAYAGDTPAHPSAQPIPDAEGEAALQTYLDLAAQGNFDPPLPPDSPWLADLAAACAPDAPPLGVQA